MVKKLCSFLFVCVCLQTVVCQSGEPCKRKKGAPGSCIALKSCEYYVNMLNELGSLATDALAEATCGFEGKSLKVCCPVPATATSAPAPTTTTHAPELISKMGVEDFVPAFLDPPVCGLSKFNALLSPYTGGSLNEYTIIGGKDAKLDDFPWMALLGYKSGYNTDWGCGGSLISSRHVLTAAHCIYCHEHRLYVVRLGELDLSREDEGAYPIDVRIKKMVTHEEYNANSYNNDIGVLVLQNDVQFTNSIRPICIPKAQEWTRDKRMETFKSYSPITAGWGQTTRKGGRATNLQYLHLPVLNNSVCAEAYKLYSMLVFDERVLCAGFLTGDKDACQGDSGGPLMQPLWSEADKKAYFYKIGVVSYGKGCAQSRFPGVYTRITHFLPWIEEKVLGHNTQ